MKYEGEEITPRVKQEIFVCCENCDGHTIDETTLLGGCRHTQNRVYDVLCLPAIRAMRQENDELKAEIERLKTRTVFG